MEESANEEVELVQPEGVDAGPLAAEGEEEDGEVAEGEGGGEGQEEAGEAVDEVRLDRGFVGVPEAVEEAFPEFLHLVVGELVAVGREPGFEDHPEGSVPGGFVA